MYENIRQKQDGTYLIVLNGMDYHISPDYPAGGDYCYARIQAYAVAYPEQVSVYEEVPLYGSSRLDEIDEELQRIDEVYRTPRTLADAATGDEYAIKRLKEADRLSQALRGERITVAGGQK